MIEQMEMVKPKTPVPTMESPWDDRQNKLANRKNRVGNMNSLSTMGTDPNSLMCVTGDPEVVKREGKQ